MELKDNQQTRLYDFKPGREHFRAEVLRGLRKKQKELPSKYFYDKRGSYLYERICNLDEYYPPRTESAIMETHIKGIAELLGPNVLLIEYGCGNCAKTRILLDQMDNPAAYVPIDISRQQLLRVAKELASNYPGLEILPVCADYTSDFELPSSKRPYERVVVYFPGSTIGNFDPKPAMSFLEHIAGVCQPDGALVIGIDLKKEPAILNSAYNDREGITAAFNLNLLRRINRELNGDFQLRQFQHHAFYNTGESRIEMHLVSLRDQIVHLDNVSIHFSKGESIWTESSYKFNLDDFTKMAAAAGLEVAHVWTDEKKWFSVQYLVNRAGRIS